MHAALDACSVYVVFHLSHVSRFTSLPPVYLLGLQPAMQPKPKSPALRPAHATVHQSLHAKRDDRQNMPEKHDHQGAHDVRNRQHHQVAVVALAGVGQTHFDLLISGDRLAQLVPALDQTELQQLPDVIVDGGQQMKVYANRHRHRVAVNVLGSRKAEDLRLRYGQSVGGVQPGHGHRQLLVGRQFLHALIGLSAHVEAAANGRRNLLGGANVCECSRNWC